MKILQAEKVETVDTNIIKILWKFLLFIFIPVKQSFARDTDFHTKPVSVSQGCLVRRSMWRAASLQSEKANHPPRTKTLAATQSNFLAILLI